jgi:hypothetical protein
MLPRGLIKITCQNDGDVQLYPGAQLHPHGRGHRRVQQVGLEGQKVLSMLD